MYQNFKTNPMICVFGGRSQATADNIARLHRLGYCYAVIDSKATVGRISNLLYTLKPEALLLSTRPTGEQRLELTRYAINSNSRIFESQSAIPSKISPTDCGEELSYVMTTSGSSGMPKGVCISRSATTTAVEQYIHDLRITSNDVIANEVAFSFDVSMFDIFAAEHTGASLRVLNEAALETAYSTAKHLNEIGATILFSVPTVMRDLLECNVELRSLRALALTGEALTRDMVQQLWRILPAHAEIWNMYGGTEMPYVFAKRITRDYTGDVASFSPNEARLDIGIDGNFDSDTWTAGQVGRLWVRGKAVKTAYLTHEGGWPEARSNGISTHDTGDLVEVLSDKCLRLVGRADREVRVQGYRVELDGIEAWLEQLPYVKGAIAFEWNEQILYVVVAVGHLFDRPDIREDIMEHGQGTLSAFRELTRLTLVSTLPKTRTGKKDRRWIREEFNAGLQQWTPCDGSGNTVGRVLGRVEGKSQRLYSAYPLPPLSSGGA